MNIKKYIQLKLEKVFKKLNLPVEFAKISFSNMPNLCDLQCNGLFAAAKQMQCNPKELADKIVNECKDLQNEFEITAVAPGFVNFKIKDVFFSKLANDCLNAKVFGPEKHAKSRNIIMDYGGANVAKELHVGHLRSPIIGESLKRVYQLLGDKVISDTHLGDWGLQMGLTVLQLHEDGYVDYFFDNTKAEKQITLDVLNVVYPKASKRSKVDKDFKAKADFYTLQIQQMKQPYYEIYKTIREISVKTIEQLYKDLNSFYDLWCGESSAEPYIETVIEIFKNKELTRVSDGALIVEVAKEGEHIPVEKDGVIQYKNPMPPAIIQKFNGGDLYATTDIATLYMRNLTKPQFDECIYFTDNRQMMHFEQVFRCTRLAGIVKENQKLTHIPFGTINGTDGKPFKTRDGEVIKLDDVINLLKNVARKKMQDNGMPYDDELALKIGVAAMKFGDLSNVVTKDYVFDIDKFASFEGKTGPYLQYTAVRIKSILQKANNEFGEINVCLKEERQILLDLLKLFDCYEICYNDYSLNSLCICTYNLASSYSAFYNNVRILSESDEQKRLSYLGLSKLVLLALEQALYVLAIDVPEKM